MNPVFLQNLITYGPAFISGLLLVLCFPTIDLFLVAWVALVPFLISLHNKEPKQAFRAGMVLGVPYFFGTLYWIYHSINHYGGVSLIGSIAIVVLLCLYLSLYPGSSLYCSRQLSEGPNFRLFFSHPRSGSYSNFSGHIYLRAFHGRA